MEMMYAHAHHMVAMHMDDGHHGTAQWWRERARLWRQRIVVQHIVQWVAALPPREQGNYLSGQT